MTRAILAAVSLLSLLSAQERKATYAVVIHVDNACKDTGDAAKATIKKLFLKELTRWSSGVEAKPYSRLAAAPEQIAFLKLVLGMSEAELARHWLRMKNLDGTTPPTDVDTDRMVLKYVARNVGAFGFVRIDASKEATGVRVLLEF
jgi:hypothetical protein